MSRKLTIKIPENNWLFISGDFSFIDDLSERQSLEHYYNGLDNFSWNIIRSTDFSNKKDLKYLQCIKLNEHDEKTFNRNICNLSIIANYGWEFFVKTYPLF